MFGARKQRWRRLEEKQNPGILDYLAVALRKVSTKDGLMPSSVSSFASITLALDGTRRVKRLQRGD